MASTSNSSSSASGPSRKYIPPALRSQQASSSSGPSNHNKNGSGSRGTSEPPWPTASAPYQQPTRRDERYPGPSSEASNTRLNGWQGGQTYQRSGPGYIQPASGLYDYTQEDSSQCRSQRKYPDTQSVTSRPAYIPPSARLPPSTTSHSAPSPRRRYVAETATLFLAGDSFVGALTPAKGPQPKELPAERGESEVEREEYGVLKREWEVYDAIPKMIKIRKEKGAAAKGLNNPRSKKNIAPKILDHGTTAFGDMYHDYNKTPRFFMMMFGNVDLNINYLWQLVNREITPASFTPEELSSAGQDLSDFTTLKKRQTDMDIASADHTENDNTPTALGPTLFVTKVIREYTSFIEREIVNGPIGAKLRGFDDAASDIHARNMGPSKNRVLVAGALPPMVKDSNLYRILGKYVDQHVEATTSTSPLKADIKLEAIGKRRASRGGHEPLVEVSGGATSASTSNSNGDIRSEVDDLAISMSTNLNIPDAQSQSEVDADADQKTEKELKLESESKSTFATLLSLHPSPCSLPIRSQMIASFNSQLSSFCAKYPKILKYISINDAMSKSHPGDEKVLEYYCSQVEGDGANVHPTWERTYPLWIEELRGVGVDVDSFPEVDLEGTEAAWTAEKGARLEGSRYKT